MNVRDAIYKAVYPADAVGLLVEETVRYDRIWYVVAATVELASKWGLRYPVEEAIIEETYF